jgi:hypothetical protein
MTELKKYVFESTVMQLVWPLIKYSYVISLTFDTVQLCD